MRKLLLISVAGFVLIAGRGCAEYALDGMNNVGQGVQARQETLNSM